MVISGQQPEREPSIRIRAAKGSIRVEAASLFSHGDDAYVENVIKRLFQLHAVEVIDVDRRHQALVIDYDPVALPVDAALRNFSNVLQSKPCASPLDHLLRRSCGSVTRVERRRNGASEHFVVGSDGTDLRLSTPGSETGAHHGWFGRLVNLALGSACFGMSIVGIMTPFVPTMPFVLATGYFLANSSPMLHELFRRSPLFGEMLCDWEEHGGWRMATKLKLFELMAIVWGATLAIAGFSWPLVVVMGLMSSISIVTILRVRTISDDGGCQN
jgi:uncharacterized membrane protein YbaN (DUF454 family)